MGVHALVNVHSLCLNVCTQKRAVQIESSFSKMPHSYRLFFHSCVPALFKSWVCLLVLLLLLSDGLQLSLPQIWPYLPSLHEMKTKSNRLMARSYKGPKKGSPSKSWCHLSQQLLHFTQLLPPLAFSSLPANKMANHAASARPAGLSVLINFWGAELTSEDTTHSTLYCS